MFCLFSCKRATVDVVCRCPLCVVIVIRCNKSEKGDKDKDRTAKTKHPKNNQRISKCDELDDAIFECDAIVGFGFKFDVLGLCFSGWILSKHT